MAGDAENKPDVFHGRGTVLPPGTFPPKASLSAGKVTITIEAAPGENDGLFARDEKGKVILDENDNPVPAVSENMVAKCVYPDGFTKNHQTNSPQDLVAKILVQLRSHYGVTEAKVVSLPEALTAGAIIELEI